VPAPPLIDWESFYVIVGSSAAALTGLMFVVIALKSEGRRKSTSGEAVQAFATPTVVHFCGVLLVSTILSTPRHSIGSLALCLAGTGVAGLVFTGWVAARAQRQKTYRRVRSDWSGSSPCPGSGTLPI